MRKVTLFLLTWASLFFLGSVSSQVFAQSVCQACTIHCDAGLNCLPATNDGTVSYCVPARGVKGVGGACIRSDDCSSGLICVGGGDAPQRVADYCKGNNPSANFSGTCQSNSPAQVTQYNCANRGGQCSSADQVSSQYTCADGKLASDCQNSVLGECWINPTTNSSVGGNIGTLLGSCVTKVPLPNNNCGQVNGACCEKTTNPGFPQYSCNTGFTNVSQRQDALGQIIPGSSTCTCAAHDTGGSCSKNTDCKSGICSGGTCSVASGCTQIPDGVSDASCTTTGGTTCSQTDPANNQNTKKFCCSSQNECSKIAAGNDFSKSLFNLCGQVPPGSKTSDGSDAVAACTNCAGHNGIWTAVGCINSTPSDIVQSLLQLGLNIAGGVALLMILASAFMLSTSQGDAKRAGQAKEWLTSAVIGLIFIIISVTILQFIGVTILHIPGFATQ